MSKPDLSWIIVAINRNDQGVVLDASEGFYDFDLLGVNGDDADDCGIYMPRAPLSLPYPPGVYRITKIKISPGGWEGPPDSQEWGGTEISGTWEQIATWERDPEQILMYRARALYDMISNVMVTTEQQALRVKLLQALYEGPEATVAATREIVYLMTNWVSSANVSRALDEVRIALLRIPHDG